MSNSSKPLRKIVRIKDKEGVTKALVVTATLHEGEGVRTRIIYPRHPRFSQLEKEKVLQEKQELGI